MTELSLSERNLTAGTMASRPRGSIGVVAAVARLMALRPADPASPRARTRGSPPGSAHLRRDLGLVATDDQWWRAMDRW